MAAAVAALVVLSAALLGVCIRTSMTARTCRIALAASRDHENDGWDQVSLIEHQLRELSGHVRVGFEPGGAEDLMDLIARDYRELGTLRDGDDTFPDLADEDIF